MKKLFKLVVVLVLLLVVAVVAGLLFLDQAVESAVERGGSYAMGVQTELGKADIALFDGEFGLEGLRVANPPGFTNPDFLTMRTGAVEVELGSLTSDTVVVPRLVLSDITLDLARNDAGTNFGVILDNLKRFEGGEPAPAPAPEEEPAPGPGKKVLLKEVVIRGVTVQVDIGKQVAGFQSTKVTLPELVITDLGTGGEGRPISEHVSEILQRLLDEVVKNGGGLIPPELLEDLKGRLADIEQLPDQLEQRAREELEGMKEQLGGEVEEQKKALEDKVKETLGDDAKKTLGDGLGDLWKKQDAKKPDGGGQ